VFYVARRTGETNTIIHLIIQADKVQKEQRPCH